ncbi:hemolysin-type calcium-binding repeat 2 copies family protein [Asticcacaulis biprosthecium C19]|uniref:Hemolysin-type calcium-binding repeat 2 copies family protein n=1 Tax=Asticcacaulis biprosthecium C19 TaxID=715226 RepID=F4QIZ4_9CAUL|nr:hemolysin-type calcium-binding repeat 2 copies family protein [Asticcacaulis biprosthecium C19]
MDGGDGNDVITSSGQGTYNAGGGNDYVFAGLTATSEVIDGGTGTDTIDTTSVFAEYSVNLVTGATNYGGESYVNFENAITGDGNDTVIGTAVANAITTGDGNDSLDGGAGLDTLVGGEGNDTYIVESAGDVVTEQADDGEDRVNSTVSYTLGDNVENMYLQGSADLSGTGNGLTNFIFGQTGNNTLAGLGGDDYLDGGTGNDSLVGGIGNDAYVIDAIGDTITELAAEGIDLVYAEISFTLGANLEILNLTGIGGTSGTGNDLDNVLEGNGSNNTLTGLGGNDQLTGGAGNDTLLGGLGNDTYVVADAGDVVTEISNQGTDEVRSTITYNLGGKQVENLTLLNGAAINGTGNTFNNVLAGNDSNNVLNGSSGNDTLSGFGGNDSLIGGVGADLMTGGLGDDTVVIDDALDLVSETPGEGTDTVQSSLTWTLTDGFENLVLTGSAVIDGTGNGAANILTGNSANNVLSGGTGDDSYYIQNTGDNVVEASNAGIDTIISSVTYSLAGRQVENLTLTGVAALNATGNSLANTLIGNDGANTLDGSGGHDRLDGGLGADSLIGGTGNDTYVVDNAGDVITEGAAAGTDLVESSLTYILGANLDQLTLTGALAINGTGNDLNNILAGNGSNNILTGGLGNDTYYIQNTGDNVVEAGGAGTDMIYSTVTYTLNGRFAETLVLNGSANINATGNSLANTLLGNDGMNTINGKGGADILSGGLNADLFLFETASGADTITDFSAIQNDSINVNAYTGGVANAGLVTQSGLNVLISLGGGNVITVTGAAVGDVLAHMVW